MPRSPPQFHRKIPRTASFEENSGQRAKTQVKELVTIIYSKPDRRSRENPTSGRLGSGASPGLIAGASEFPLGEEVFYGLNGRSWLPAFWQVVEANSNFRQLNKIYIYFFFCDAPSCVCLLYV